jgi:hypothetical protein
VSKIYQVLVSYSLKHHGWGSLDVQLTMRAGKACDGAGTGFGWRDIDWSWPTPEERDEAFERISGFLDGKPGIELRKDEWDEDDVWNPDAAPASTKGRAPS